MREIFRPVPQYISDISEKPSALQQFLKQTNFKMTTLSLIFIVFGLSSTSLALDFKTVEEVYQCETFEIASNYNGSWVQGVPFFYAPLWSKGFVSSVREQVKTLTQLNLSKQNDFDGGCFYYSYHKNHDLPVYAYDNYYVFKVFSDPIRKGIIYFTTPNATLEEPAEYMSTSHTTMTDNKTFYVSINSWIGGTKNFIVSATVPVLPEETLSKIKKHLISFGFKPENFDVQDYTNCTPPPASLSIKN